MAHPFAPYPSGTFARSFEGFDAVEVWNGRWTSDVPWQADNPAALAKWADDLAATRQHPAGDRQRPAATRQHPAATRQHPAGARRRPAVGNSDAHLPGQLGTPQTVVRADSLTTGALLAALRAGRCWIAESAGVALSFTASAGDRHADIGDHLTAGDHPVTVTVEVGGVPGGTITLHTDRGQVLAGAGTLTWETDARRSSFVRAEVRHPGGHPAALTNPIFLD